MLSCASQTYEVYSLTLANGVITHAEYLYKITVTNCVDTGSDTGGSGGIGGSGGSGGISNGGVTGDPSSPLPKCVIKPSAALQAVKGKIVVNVYQGGGTGGGSTGGTIKPCPDVPVPPNDPCAQAKKLVQDLVFKSKMNDLKSKTGLPNEVEYYTNAQGGYTYIQGLAGQASIDFTVNSPISSYIHTHYTGTFPTFSGSDIKAIYDLQQKGNISNISTFTAAVVSASGTTYLMTISDPTKFAAFGAKNFNNTANFGIFEHYYDNNKNVYEKIGNNNVTSFELALLEALKDSGVTVLKGNSNYSSWNIITKKQRKYNNGYYKHYKL